MKFVIVEVANNNQIDYIHTLEVSGYREITSVNCFFHSLKNRNQSREALFVLFPEHEFVSRPKVEGMARPVKAHHKSIWDFYKYVGYDYKRQKWLKSIYD